MSDDEEKKHKCAEGAPGWIVTFADLMSLLLTFFILLLSFAEMDMRKFKKAVGSIKDAFGVQTKGLFENSITSNNPFKDSYGKGSKEWVDMGFSQPQISISDDHFCELEQQRKASDAQDLKNLQETLRRKIAESNLDYVSVFIDKGILKVRMDQRAFFPQKSESPRKEALPSLSQVVKILNQNGIDLSMQFTSYSPVKLDNSNMSDWRLSVQRTVLLGYLAQKISAPNIKDITVRNLIANTKVRGSTDYIDMFIGIHHN